MCKIAVGPSISRIAVEFFGRHFAICMKLCPLRVGPNKFVGRGLPCRAQLYEFNETSGYNNKSAVNKLVHFQWSWLPKHSKSIRSHIRCTINSTYSHPVVFLIFICNQGWHEMNELNINVALTLQRFYNQRLNYYALHAFHCIACGLQYNSTDWGLLTVTKI